MRLEPAPPSCFASALWLWGGVVAAALAGGAIFSASFFARTDAIALVVLSGVAFVLFAWLAVYAFGSLITHSRIALARQHLLYGDDNVVALATGGWTFWRGAGQASFGDLGMTLRCVRRSNYRSIVIVIIALAVIGTMVYGVHTERPTLIMIVPAALICLFIPGIDLIFISIGELFADSEMDRSEILIRPHHLVRTDANGPLLMLHLKGFGREGPQRLWLYLPQKHRLDFYKKFDSAYPGHVPESIRRSL